MSSWTAMEAHTSDAAWTVPDVVDTVTFDVWNTLLHEPSGHLAGLRRRAWLDLLAAAGHPVAEAAVEAALRDTWREHDRRWRAAGTPFSAEVAARHAVDLLGVPAGEDV